MSNAGAGNVITLDMAAFVRIQTELGAAQTNNLIAVTTIERLQVAIAEREGVVAALKERVGALEIDNADLKLKLDPNNPVRKQDLENKKGRFGQKGDGHANGKDPSQSG